MTNVVLDISRLISRVRHSRPSGVDRVEMAYARGLIERYQEQLAFSAVHPTGIYGRVERELAISYLDTLEERWESEASAAGQRSLISVLSWMQKLLPNRNGVGSGGVLVQVSPHHLHRPRLVQQIMEREQARFVCLVHDLIPIEYPEYARPGGAELHRTRMACVARHADHVIVNSEATGASFRRWGESAGAIVPPIHVALLGTQSLPAPDLSQNSSDEAPYFVCLGTIEPRKNHLLLLHLWRHMAETLPRHSIPKLKIIGRRGWENEQIIDLLDRSPQIAPFVEEINDCSDEELSLILSGASGLLMPSFAEGYGMPIAEALSRGVTVIASNIAAHKEAGSGAPDYIDPLDGKEWQRYILDYAKDGPLRKAQLERLSEWVAPDWGTHLNIAESVIEDAALAI